jgi:large subunit ribosomal protein L21
MPQGWFSGALICIPNFPAAGHKNGRVVCGEVKIGENKKMKYAILDSGGKQYKAVEGSSIEVDLLEVNAGDPVNLDQVLLLVDGAEISVGAPTVKGATVKTVVVGHVKGPKIEVFRYAPKKRIRRKTGHRQQYTQLKVVEIAVE